MDRGQEVCSELEKEKRTTPIPRGARSRENPTWENAARFAYDVYDRFQRTEKKCGRWWSIWKMRTTECNSNCWWNFLCNMPSPSQDGLKQHSRKERLPWDLETGSSLPIKWLWDFHKAPPVPSPPQCIHKGVGGSERQWFKPGAYACGRRAYLQNSQWHQDSSHCCPGAAGKSAILVPRVRNQSKQGASPVAHPQQQSSRTCNASSLLQWRSHRTHEQTQIPRDPLRQNVDVQHACRIKKTWVHERTVLIESHGFKS